MTGGDIMRQAALLLVVMLGLAGFTAFETQAANPCIECQNKCLAKINLITH